MTDNIARNAAIVLPIGLYVSELGEPKLPEFAIGACMLRYRESGPMLRALLSRASEGATISEAESIQFFRALHIVGGKRDPLAFEPLMRLLHLPSDDLEWLLGDTLTETVPRIIASVFDGNADALFDAIADRNVDEVARDSLLRAATFLTWDGRIDRSRMVAFLERFATGELAEDLEFVWSAWANAIAMLGLRDLEPLVTSAVQRGALNSDLIDREYFDADLEQAERAPRDGARFTAAHLGYLDDVIGALKLFPGENHDPDSGLEPVTNPMRHVGRNDPCPCGSGKKAKRCCLAA